MSDGDALKAALRVAVDLLARQAYTTSSLREKLRRRGHGDAAIDEAIARLAQLRALDDRGFADSLVRRKRRDRGRSGLRRELMLRGIDAPTAEAATADVDTASEAVAAMALLERHAWRFEGARGKARAAAFLARRGFESEVVREVLEREWGDEGEGEP
jgi:regulatory protein